MTWQQILCIIVIDLKSITIVGGGENLARPVKKQPEQWKKEILDAAKPAGADSVMAGTD